MGEWIKKNNELMDEWNILFDLWMVHYKCTYGWNILMDG